jgi:hypothetical protein
MNLSRPGVLQIRDHHGHDLHRDHVLDLLCDHHAKRCWPRSRILVPAEARCVAQRKIVE